MPLIIKNKRIADKEAEAVSLKVEERLQTIANIPENLPEKVEFDDDDGTSAEPHKVSTTRISGVIQPEVRKSIGTTDNIVERIRKYIPAEVMVSWAMIKVGFDDAFDGPADTPGEITTFTTVWIGFVGVVFLYVFESLRRERLVVHLDNDLSIIDMLSHSLLSSLAFVLYSMTLGPPFNLWNVPEWLPFVGMAVFTLMVSAIGDPYVAPAAKPATEIVSRGLNAPLMATSHPVSDHGEDDDDEDLSIS